MRTTPVLLTGLLAMLALSACDGPLAPEVEAGPEPGISHVESEIVITRMRGAGTLGDGSPTSSGGIWQQDFDFNVGIDNGVIDGVLVYVDHAVMKDDGEPAELRVSSLYPGTAILTFVQTSSNCVEFEGTGYLINTGELLAFKAEACDNGSTNDIFGITVPQRLATHGGVYTRRDMISSGGIIKTVVGALETGMTELGGSGTLGSGETTGDGIWLQEFAMDVGVTKGVASGVFDYTDHAVNTNGSAAHLRAAPDTPGTAVTNFVQVSSTCAEFSGVVRYLNTGDLLRFRARGCDNGSPGVDVDVFGIWVPDRGYQRGPDLLSDGDLVATIAG